MKLFLVLLPACLALVLSACSSPSSPATGGPNNGNNSGTPGGTTSSTYFFKADYTVLDSLTSGQGAIYPYIDNGMTFNAAMSLAGTTMGSYVNNNLPKGNPGDSVSVSVTLGGTEYSGSATVPSALAGVALAQGSPLTPVSGAITIDSNQDLVVSWSTAALPHPAAWVTVLAVDSHNVSSTFKAAFSAGTLTLAHGSVASGSTFTVYATNEATDLAPTAHLDAVHAYFRVNHAVNDASDRFTVN